MENRYLNIQSSDCLSARAEIAIGWLLNTRSCGTVQKTNSPWGSSTACAPPQLVPSLTPWGYTARHKTIHNGVYWIETDQCVSTLAVCCVIRDDFSKAVLDLSETTEYDREHGLDQTIGYIFFRGDDICLPLLELVRGNDQWDWSLIDRQALMNAVWRSFPEYAAAYNMREQQGKNDCFGMLLLTFGIETELRSSLENMIVLTPGVGTQFFNFL